MKIWLLLSLLVLLTPEVEGFVSNQRIVIGIYGSKVIGSRHVLGGASTRSGGLLSNFQLEATQDMSSHNCGSTEETSKNDSNTHSHDGATTTTAIDSNLSSLPPLAVLSLLATATIIALPQQALAASAGVVPAALVAYVHYASQLVAVAAVMVERCTVHPGMSAEEEKTLVVTDLVYFLAAIGLGVSGYYRVVEFEKGWDFYSHEPLFWLKLSLVGVWAASSLFPTIQICKRYLEHQSNSPPPPMSTALAARLKQVMNAELTALLSIPLTATLMARGVLYMPDIPWQAGAAVVTLVTLGLSYKYAKEALTWKEPPAIALETESRSATSAE